MTIEKMAAVIAVDAMDQAVALWSILLDARPTFVDGDRWAQFDTPAGRIALGAGSEAPDGNGLMFKSSDLAGEHRRFAEAGLSATPIQVGRHERRFVVQTAGTAVTFYAPL